VPTEFSELGLTLASQHVASTIYDVFVFSNSGVVTLVTGPAWSVSTAGAGARGSGASTTQLTRVKGLLVNAVQMTGRNGATTYTVAANRGTYVGSLFIDGSAGQVTCDTAYGQSRKWGVWNQYNRSPIILKGGDSTASWLTAGTTVRPQNNATANSLTVFSGFADEWMDITYQQNATNNIVNALPGIGWNSTTAAASSLNSGSGTIKYLRPPTAGINVVTALEGQVAAGAVTFAGTEASMLLSARWNG
jgi:hypothetical protein